jgi:hypothetical protein
VDPDDFEADPSTTGAIAVGGSDSGVVDFDGDQDWFRISTSPLVSGVMATSTMSKVLFPGL